MKVRVVAAVVDTKKLLLYKEDGKTISVLQGDPRMQALINQVLPIVQNGDVAEIDLLERNEYRAFEEESGGIVRFFRAAKRFVFGSTEEEGPGVLFGKLPDQPELTTRNIRAVQDIMANAQPVTAEDFNAEDTAADETIVAVVEAADGTQTAIPGAEMLAALLDHSARNRNTIGVQNLFKRMAGYVKQRQHSVEDLLRFLEKGDLPIADDGSIVAYKRLYSTKEDGVFVDPHSRKVTQKVGDYVCVHESLVDKNRRNECSNGLHIGRRGYMGSFHGDVVVLCKIAPEDVIVVPHNDPNKVRVCGYHILARLNDEAKDRILSNKPMTEIKGLPELLGKVLAGDHVGRLRTVEITKAQGGGLKITETGRLRKERGNNQAKPAHAIDDVAAQPESRVDPKDVAKQVVGSRQARAQELLAQFNKATFLEKRINLAMQLVAYKKQVKVGWDKLGIDTTTVEQITELANSTKTPTKPPKATPDKSRTSVIPPKLRKSDPAKVAEALVKETPAPASKTLNKVQQLRQMHDSMQDLLGYGDTKSKALAAVQARKLLNFRRAAKKSWAGLGLADVTDDQLKEIINAAPVLAGASTWRDVPHEPVAVAPEPAAPAPAPLTREPGSRLAKAKSDRLSKEMTPKKRIETATELGISLAVEMDLSSERKAALALVRGGKTISAASKETGVHRRTIDRDVTRFGK